MITTEEIAVRVYQMLQESEVKTMISGVIDYESERLHQRGRNHCASHNRW